MLITMGNSTIKLSVEIYQSDFGTVSIVNSNPKCSADTYKLRSRFLREPRVLWYS